VLRWRVFCGALGICDIDGTWNAFSRKYYSYGKADRMLKRAEPGIAGNRIPGYLSLMPYFFTLSQSCAGRFINVEGCVLVSRL